MQTTNTNILKIGNIINTINTNKYFYGILMILLNIGSRYIEIKFSKSQKQILGSKMLRRILIFTVCFISTRDIIVSLILTASFIIIVLNLFNDESEYCILPKSFRNLNGNDLKKFYDDDDSFKSLIAKIAIIKKFVSDIDYRKKLLKPGL